MATCFTYNFENPLFHHNIDVTLMISYMNNKEFPLPFKYTTNIILNCWLQIKSGVVTWKKSSLLNLRQSRVRSSRKHFVSFTKQAVVGIITRPAWNCVLPISFPPTQGTPTTRGNVQFSRLTSLSFSRPVYSSLLFLLPPGISVPFYPSTLHSTYQL